MNIELQKATLEMSPFFFLHNGWPVIVVGGADRIDYLHRISSQHFRRAKVDDILLGAFLNAKGGVIALFHAWIRKNDIVLFVLPEKITSVLEALDKFHFGEDLSFRKSMDFQMIEFFGSENKADQYILSNLEDHWVKGSGGSQFPNHFVCVSEKPGSDSKISMEGAREIQRTEIEGIKTLWGFPTDGVDISESNIILEFELGHYVHENKGCYPGQEVIERIRTYGKVAKCGVILELADDESKRHKEKLLNLPVGLVQNSESAGSLTSFHVVAGKAFGIGTMFRTQAKVGTPISASEVQFFVGKCLGQNA